MLLASRMHIAVNTRLLLSDRLEGISRFAYEVLQRLVVTHPEVRFSFLFDRPYDSRFVFGENVQAYVVPPPARHPLLWHAWFHLMVPRKLDRLQADLFFSPEFYLSSAKQVPQVPVFHDLAYEHYPQDIGAWASRYCRRYSPRYARRARHILTVSEFSKQDIVDHYSIAPDKITVVYNGAGAGFGPLSSVEQQVVRDRFSQGKPYFHFVGTLHPRKNIETLLRAFDRFKSEYDSPVQLLLVGRKGWQYDTALRTYEAMQHRESVHFTGFVSETELYQLYAASAGLCYVPYLEGFGIPLVEAMHSEIPIICSDRSSLPEVAGDAALQVSPFDEKALANALARLWHEPDLRESLVAVGRIQRQRFSWDRTAQQVWEVLQAQV